MKLPGIGKETGYKLLKMGVETVQTLSEIPVNMMQNLLGKTGIELHKKANGIDDSPVVPYREQKSISTEETFSSDTIDMKFIHKELVRMTEKIAFELRSQNRLTGCITVKIRYSDFQTETRQSTLSYTSADHVLIKKVKELFTQLYQKRQLIRLIGIRFTDLIPGTYQINLFDDTAELISLYQAIDSVKRQFGEQFLIRAAGAETQKPLTPELLKAFRM